MDEHSECPEVLRKGMEPIKLTVSTTPPPACGPHTTKATCPHGTTYWVDPTPEQAAQWAAEAEESCWCCREHGLTTPATHDGGLCEPCAGRSPSACKTAHEREREGT